MNWNKNFGVDAELFLFGRSHRCMLLFKQLPRYDTRREDGKIGGLPFRQASSAFS